MNPECCGHMVLKAGSAKETGNKTEFEGIISSTRLDHHYERFSVPALEKMAKRANKGVKVLAEHNSAGQPIGRSMSASYDKETEQITSKFYIQKGLQLRASAFESGYADSDSYIAAAQEGTTDGLSVGALVNKEVCDHCGEDMKRFTLFGMQFVYCKNQHYPGQKLYIDKDGKEHYSPEKGRKEKLVTATIEDADLFEFSMVAFGANPDAQITEELQKAFDAGELSELHLAQLNDRFAIKLRDKKLVGGIPPMLGGADMATPIADQDQDQDQDKDQEPTTDPTPEPTPVQKAEPTPKPLPAFEDKSLHDALKSDLDEANEIIDELEEENERLKTYETQCEELQKDLQKKDAEIAALNAARATIDKKVVKIQKYEQLVIKAVDTAMYQFTRTKHTFRPGEEDAKKAELLAMDDYERIMGWADLWEERADKRDKRRKRRETATPESILAQQDIDKDLYV